MWIAFRSANASLITPFVIGTVRLSPTTSALVPLFTVIVACCDAVCVEPANT